MKNYFLLLTFLLFSAAALQAQNKNSSPLALSEGPRSLFDGKTLSGWRTYQNKPADSWFVKEGMICNKGNKDPQTKHADLISEKQYENFELSLDWKIAPEANSGILYMVSENYPASYYSGPEYQLIDDTGYPGKLEDWQKTGANYAMNPPLVNATRPAGEWNHTVIKVFKGSVQHWLNGKKVADYILWNDEWKKLKATGKWKDHPEYGMTPKGHIAFQDHGGEVCLKNIELREL